jgi:hypothetical protein
MRPRCPVWQGKKNCTQIIDGGRLLAGEDGRVARGKLRKKCAADALDFELAGHDERLKLRGDDQAAEARNAACAPRGQRRRFFRR